MKRFLVMEKRRYLKHPENGRVLAWSQILAERGDMVPCDVDGNPLDEDYVMPEVERFKMPDVIHSAVDGWGLGDPEKRKAIESQINKKIREGNDEWGSRNSVPYDGVMGIPPEWVHERDRIRFEWERNLLLNEYNHEEITEFIELYPRYLEGKLDDLCFAEMRSELVHAIGYLTLIKKANDSEVEEGINMLAGDHAARGYKIVSSASEGGKAKGKNASKEKEDVCKIAKQITEKRSRMPSRRELARLVVREKYPKLKGKDAERKAEAVRQLLIK
jgi:hypothetical protein